MFRAKEDVVLQIIRDFGPLSTKEIQELAKKNHLHIEKEDINSLLYGPYREVVVRDRDDRGFTVWRMKEKNFEAAKGYEWVLYQKLLKKKVITPSESTTEYEIENPRTRKLYRLDIAVIRNQQKYDIEVDGLEHMRADARLSIQKQLLQRKKDIEIDWMDNASSYVDFSEIDSKLVNTWCTNHLEWCIQFHEELLWPHDITRNIWLIDNGWSVMRLWNMEVKNDLKRCVKEIQEWIS